jgi:hypothetical protein
MRSTSANANGGTSSNEFAELLDVDVGEQVWTGREQLAELQVRGAQLLERAAELDRAFARRGPLGDHADLSENAQEPPAARGARNLERAPRALESGHKGVFSRLVPV